MVKALSENFLPHQEYIEYVYSLFVILCIVRGNDQLIFLVRFQGRIQSGQDHLFPLQVTFGENNRGFKLHVLTGNGKRQNDVNSAYFFSS